MKEEKSSSDNILKTALKAAVYITAVFVYPKGLGGGVEYKIFKISHIKIG